MTSMPSEAAALMEDWDVVKRIATMFSCRAPRFTTFHAGLKVREGLAARPGVATTYADQYQVGFSPSAPQSAICAEEPMSRGAHYAEFLVESGDRMLIGVVDNGHLSQASGASPPWPWKEPRTWALEISRSVLAAPCSLIIRLR